MDEVVLGTLDRPVGQGHTRGTSRGGSSAQWRSSNVQLRQRNGEVVFKLNGTMGSRRRVQVEDAAESGI